MPQALRAHSRFQVTHAQESNKNRTAHPKQYLATANEIAPRKISKKQVRTVNSTFTLMNYSAQPRHADNLNDPTALTINRALWPTHNSPYYERLLRRPPQTEVRPVIGGVI
ncbi:hypothetical protein AVEN_75305-1 [Araneus ventricosus]|uniref:Uncharacterized protein n=1 Tax=Araneus ventricosus TaxID=182803 RepID=A0A4Y2G5I4_ARAVE|nr:hypothetical protein AVEN_75305-1 [Araneus ventricosus]